MINFFVIKNDEVVAVFDTLIKARNFARFLDECFILNGLTGSILKFKEGDL